VNIGSYKGPRRCNECNSKGPGLRELQFRFFPEDGLAPETIILCPGCAPTLQHVLKNEFSRPHMKEVMRQKGRA
jgi:hypothetical protein